jgi:hypothetical protein
MVDFFEKNPLEAHRQKDGEIQFTNTGDSLIDKWEEQLAQDDEVDLLEAFTPESMERLKTLLDKAKEQREDRSYVDAMNETVERIERRHAEQQQGSQHKYPTFGDDY